MEKTKLNSIKNIFEKIKINNIYNILYYLDFFTIVEISFLNKRFKILCHKKFYKRIKMITASINIYKKKIIFHFPQDFHHLLSHNSIVITKEIKPMIINEITDYFFKLPVLKFYINKLNDKKFEKISLKNKSIGKKSMKYLSYYIENNSIVKGLNLSRNKVIDKILSPLCNTIATAENLNFLKLNSCVLDFISMKNLNSIISLNSSINSLSLRNCDLDDELLLIFNSLQNIRSLNLAGNKISTKGLQHILLLGNSLEILNLDGNNLNNIGALYLSLYLKSSTSKLKELYIGNNYIRSSGVRSIIYSLGLNPKSQLRTLDISHNLCENLDHVTLNRTGLNKLILAGVKFDYNQLENFLNSCNDSNMIKWLNLSDSTCFLKDKEGEILFEKLLTNEAINRLELNNCYIGSDKSLKSMLNYFKNQKSKITELSLASNNLYRLHSDILSEIICLNKLKYLNLSDNQLNLWTEEKFKIFAIELGENRSLEVINLNSNHLQEKMHILLDCLKFNSSLIEIHLEDNKINSDANANSINNFFQFNRTVKMLTLARNNINDLFFRQIFENMLKNEIIMKCDLSRNDISINGVMKLVDYVLDCGILLKKEIVLKSDCINSSFLTEDILKLRKNIEKFKNLII